MLLCRLRKADAAGSGLGAHGGDQTGEMENGDALPSENLLQIVVFQREGAAHLAGPVVPDPGSPRPKAGIRNVELMPHAPGPVRLDLRPPVIDPPGPELTADEFGDGAACDKAGQGKALPAESGGDIEHIRLSAGGLHGEELACVHRHAVSGGDAHAHARGAGDGIPIDRFDLHRHLRYQSGRR